MSRGATPRRMMARTPLGSSEMDSSNGRASRGAGHRAWSVRRFERSTPYLVRFRTYSTTSAGEQDRTSFDDSEWPARSRLEAILFAFGTLTTEESNSCTIVLREQRNIYWKIRSQGMNGTRNGDLAPALKITARERLVMLLDADSTLLLDRLLRSRSRHGRRMASALARLAMPWIEHADESDAPT